jgi:hypothetical protein
VISLRSGAAWLWEHRTKAIGTVGMGASYAYANQDKLGLFIPAKQIGATLGLIGATTFLIGLYNTFGQKRTP